MSIAADEREAIASKFAGRLRFLETAADNGAAVAQGVWDRQPVEVAWFGADTHPDWARTVERRRHAPTPPCPPLVDCRVEATGVVIVSSRPPGEPLDRLAPPACRDEALARLDAIAAAIDQLHRFRLAHGQLNDRCVLFDGSTIWLVGVGIAWGDLGSNEDGSPQERDIAFFAGLAHRLLSAGEPTPTTEAPTTRQAIRPAERVTARALIARLREATAIREPHSGPQTAGISTQTEEPAAATPAARAPTTSHRLRWLAAAVVGVCLTALIGGGVAIQRGWPRAPATSFLASVRPPRPQQATRWHLCKEMVRQVRQHRSIAAVEALLATDGPDQIEFLLALVNDRDESLQRFLIDAASKITWTPEKRAKLSYLEASSGGLGGQSLAHWFLAACTADSLATIEQMRRIPAAPLRVAALEALARLGQPVTAEELIGEYRRAADPTPRRKLLLLAMSYPETAELTAFLEAQLFDGTGRPRPLLFELAFERPCPIAAKLVGRALRKTLANQAELSVADFLPAWVATARLWRQVPEARTLIPTMPVLQPRFLREAAGSLLSETGIRTRIGDELLPDSWHTQALSWPDARPLDFLDSLYLSADSRVEPLDELRLQSMLLALANVEEPATQEALAVKLIARTPWEAWESARPAALAAVVTVLAASGTVRGATFVDKYLGNDYLGRSPLYWEAAVAGAALAPGVTDGLLGRAAEHPLPAISVRARRVLALQATPLHALRAIQPAPLPEKGSLISLVDRLRFGAPADRIYLREAEADHSQLVGLALVLCDTPRAAADLYARWVEGGASFADTYLLANLSETNVVGLWEGFLPHSEWPSLMQQPMLSTAGLLRDATWAQPVWRIAAGQESRAPLWHRYLAVRALGEFHHEPGSTYLEILAHESSVLVQHAAAVSFLLATFEPDTALVSKLTSQSQAMRPKVRSALLHGRAAPPSTAAPPAR